MNKKIHYNHILISLICVVLAAVLLTAGIFYKRILPILAILAFACYLYIDKRYLRCPKCFGFTNLDRLLYAKNHPYHCHSCGELIEIDVLPKK